MTSLKTFYDNMFFLLSFVDGYVTHLVFAPSYHFNNTLATLMVTNLWYSCLISRLVTCGPYLLPTNEFILTTSIRTQLHASHILVILYRPNNPFLSCQCSKASAVPGNPGYLLFSANAAINSQTITALGC